MYCIFRLLMHVCSHYCMYVGQDSEETSSLLSHFLDMGGGVNINFKVFSSFAFFFILFNFLLEEIHASGKCPSVSAVFLLPLQIIADISSYGLGIFLILILSKLIPYLDERGIKVWLLELCFTIAGALLLILHGILFVFALLGGADCK